MLILCAIAGLVTAPAISQEPAPAALPAASTTDDHDANQDESTWAGAAALELGIFQSIHGALIGAELCQRPQCRSKELPPYLYVGAGLGALAGGAAGLKLRPHQAMLINSGTALGLLHGVALSWDDNSRDDARIWITGQLVGTAVGALAGQLWHPENGRLAMANSAALWTATTVTLARNAAGRSSNAAWAMATADAAYLFGLVAWDSKPQARARLAVVDLAGALGLWLGGAGGAVVGKLANWGGDRGLYAGAAAGAALGAILAVTLVPLPDKPLSVQLLPQPNGLALGGAF